MNSFDFPGTTLVRVGSRITQVRTFFSNGGNGDDSSDEEESIQMPELSPKAQKLLQDILWATIVSPPALEPAPAPALSGTTEARPLTPTTKTETTRVELDHEEFCLTIIQKPWKLPLKYDILIDGKVIEPTPYKLWFGLQRPPA